MVNINPIVNVSFGQLTSAGIRPHSVLLVVPHVETKYFKDLTNLPADSYAKYLVDKFKKINPVSPVSVLGMEATGTKPTATITVADDVASDFVVNISLGNTVTKVSIPATTTSADATKLIADAINSNANARALLDLDVTDAGALTYKWQGITKINFTVDNDLVTITGFSETASTIASPDFSLIGDDYFKTIMLAEGITENSLDVYLANREDTTNYITKGVGVFYNKEDVTEAYSNKFLVKLGYKLAKQTPDDYLVTFVAKRSLRLTDGAFLGSNVANSVGTANIVGGAGLSVIPYANTPLSPQFSLVSDFNDISSTEKKDLKAKRFTLASFNYERNATALDVAYTLDRVEDTLFTTLNNVDAMMVIEEIFFYSLKEKYKQSTYVRANAKPQRGQVTDKIVKAELSSIYQRLEEFGVVQDNLSFAKNLIVNFNVDLEGFIIEAPVYLVGQIRAFNIRFNLTNKGE